jgi:hypothetical protein
LWSAAFVLLGFLFWHSLEEAIAIAKRGSLAFGGTVAVVIAVVAAYRYVRARAGRARRAESPPSTDPPRTAEGRNLAVSAARRHRQAAR